MSNQIKNNKRKGVLWKLKTFFGLKNEDSNSEENIEHKNKRIYIDDIQDVEEARKTGELILTKIDLIYKKLRDDSIQYAQGNTCMTSSDIQKLSHEMHNLISSIGNLSGRFKDAELQKMFEKSMDSFYIDYLNSRFKSVMLAERQKEYRRIKATETIESISAIPSRHRTSSLREYNIANAKQDSIDPLTDEDLIFKEKLSDAQLKDYVKVYMEILGD